jgi:endonuclease I
MRPLSPLPFILLHPLATAAEPPGYYAGVTNQTGDALRQALHDIIDDHAALPYTPTRDALRALDEDPANANNVLLIYSRRSEPKTNFAVNGNATTWNREHLWPNSLGIDDAVPAYSDLFNLRAADLDVNNRRANLNFDESSAAEGNVSADPEAPLSTKDSNSWEVPAAVKGDIARSMFYMDVRYAGDAAGEPDLILTDKLNEVTSNGTKFGRLTTLLLWHLEDPVDDAERLRNDRAQAQQGNRNPFVDRPDYVFRVFGDPLAIRVELPAPNQLRLVWWDQLSAQAPQRSANLATWQNVPGAVNTEGSWRVALLPVAPTEGRFFFRVPYQKPNVP